MASKKIGQMAETALAGGGQDRVNLAPIRKQLVHVTVRGISPLIQHQWSAKSREMMRDKHVGRKTKNRDVRDPQQEGKDATYRTKDGQYGIPVTAFKSAIISAAHKDIGIEKTLVRKAVFIRCSDPGMIVPLLCDGCEIVEDCVRVGQGSTDLRYRPYFYTWSVPLTIQIDGELLRVEDLITLLDRAGFGVGVGERRPEKGGDFGRFEVDTNTGLKVESL